jgi:hypothetical protein
MKTTKTDFIKALESAQESILGVIYLPVERLNDGRDLCIVLGWTTDYEKGYLPSSRYEKEVDGFLYTLCGKLAVNIDDLQCDYDIDWYQPYDDKGEVFDTEIVIGGESDYEWFVKQAKDIAGLMNKGVLKV